MFNKVWIDYSYKARAAQHQKNVDLKEYLPLDPFSSVLCQFNGELRVDKEVVYLSYLK